MSEAEIVVLAHGSGGSQSHELVERIFLNHFGQPSSSLEDAAELTTAGRLAFTTDSYVVQPLFFPGGNIGRLAVCGTVNDLAMRGAQPLCLSAAFILEEGFSLVELERVVEAMQAALGEAGVTIVTGDTKVVERGSADKVFINTAGIGLVPPRCNISVARAQPGDVVIVSGAMGDHGLTVMTQRQGLRFNSPLQSDSAPLNSLVAKMQAVEPDIHVLRDPTRGGLATTLNEIAAASQVGIEIDETAIPLHAAVQAASEILGLDPLYVANEGKLVAVVPAESAQRVFAAMRSHPLGTEASIIGRIVSDHARRVVLRTILGTQRLLDLLVGEQLPRIC
ncbi:MAG: hydrogenase expression/formation protein HypE [Anaerolineae bacterium]